MRCLEIIFVSQPILINLPSRVTTPRLYLRPLTDADIVGCYAAVLESFDEMTQYYSPKWSRFDKAPPIEEIVKDVRTSQSDWAVRKRLEYGVFNSSDDVFIGLCALHHLDWNVPKGRIGYWVRTGMAGNGYATEVANVLTGLAFDHLDFHKLEIRADKRNVGSRSIAQRLGFQYVALLEKNLRGKEGDLWDLEVYVRFNAQELSSLSIKYHYLYESS